MTLTHFLGRLQGGPSLGSRCHTNAWDCQALGRLRGLELQPAPKWPDRLCYRGPLRTSPVGTFVLRAHKQTRTQAVREPELSGLWGWAARPRSCPLSRPPQEVPSFWCAPAFLSPLVMTQDLLQLNGGLLGTD